MYKQCRTEQSANRQRELERGLMELMLAMPYEDISVSDLCEQMNVPRKSFYRYFSSKDGALHALIDHTLLEYESFENHCQGKRTLVGELTQFFDFWVLHRPLLDALAKSSLTGELIQRSIDYAVSETVLPNRFLAAEEIRMRSHVVQFAVCGLMTMMIRWHHEGYRTSVKDMAIVAARLMERPLFPDASNLL